jgi:hydroxypyruvate isomerase
MAKRYGFASLEFHDEARSEDRNNLKQLLSKIDLPINSINVRMGETSGCAAIPQHAD